MAGHLSARLEVNELARSARKGRDEIPVDNPYPKRGPSKSNQKSGVSRAEIRFQRFCMAQQALFEAESRLNKRLEEDLKMTQEFNAMELKLKQLLSSKATMVSYLGSLCDRER